MDVVFVSYLVAIFVSFAVGIPTIVRAWHRHDTALILLGAAVSFDGFEWLVWTLSSYTSAYGTTLGFALSIACRLGIAASVLCMIQFTRLVFRPNSTAASAFAALLACLLLASFVASGAVGDWEGVRKDQIWVWVEQFALMAGYGWTSVEAARQYALSRRRAAYGLGDPLAAHRLLLWSVYAGMFFIAEAVYVITLAFYGMLSDLDALNALITVIAELALCTAVFTPHWYAATIKGASAAKP
jgi:hypothetical protein